MSAMPVAQLASEQLFELDRPLREARDAFEKSYFEFLGRLSKISVVVVNYLEFVVLLVSIRPLHLKV
jgi:hypothetical protein